MLDQTDLLIKLGELVNEGNLKIKTLLVETLPETEGKTFSSLEEFEQWFRAIDFSVPSICLKISEDGKIALETATQAVVAPAEIPAAPANSSIETKVTMVAGASPGDRIIKARVAIVATNEKGYVKKFAVHGQYKDSKGRGIIDINVEEDIDRKDMQEILNWSNEQTEEVLDFTIKGPAYEVDQNEFHNIGLGKFCADQLHAAVLDAYIEQFNSIRSQIKKPFYSTGSL